MSISFSHIPSNERVPLFYAEMDNSMANTATATQYTLIIGQQLDSATATAGELVLISSANDVAGICGYGSMLHRMATAYFDNDSNGFVYALPLADGTSSVAATGKITITSVATETGVISLYVGGIRIQCTITSSDTLAEIATALADAINDEDTLEVTASASSAVVTLTAKNKGVCGNYIDLRLNYLGASDGEELPDGMAMTITAMSGGLITPDLTDALANVGDKAFDFIVCPYTDTTSLNALKSFLNDSDGRWGPLQQIYGHFLAAYKGTYGEQTAFGGVRNDQHGSVIGVYDSPTPPYVWAAGGFGAMADSLRNDPGLPVQTLEISGVLAPPQSSRFTITERNNLLHSGISTFSVATDGTVSLENVITTYQTNSYGVADDSYLEIETMYLLMYITRYLKTAITSKFGRMKLADDGTKFASGSSIVTPSTIKAELIAQYTTLEYNGYVQGSDDFAANLIVERNSSNVNRIDVLYPDVLINQLRIFALKNQFRLKASS